MLPRHIIEIERGERHKERLGNGTEERGRGYRVKETRIYVQLQLQSTSSSRRELRSGP
jgi:hypothetical protein